MLAIGTLTHSIRSINGLTGHSLVGDPVGSNCRGVACLANVSDPTSTMEAFYRHTCKEHPHAALMGFKLKPYIDFEPG